MLEPSLTPYIPQRFLEDEHYRQWHIRGINPLPEVKVLGVHIPDLRRIAQDSIKEGKATTMLEDFKRLQAENSRSGLLYEEKMIWGMLLDWMPCTLQERLDGFRDFIPAIDNWAVCDYICDDSKWCKGHLKETWDFLQPYFSSDQEFDVRFALVMCIEHFLTDEYIDAVFDKISQLDYEKIVSEYEFSKTPAAGHGQVLGPVPYYVKMAVAWLLATALYHFPDKTRQFANSGALPDTVLKLYLRKARESFRTKTVAAL